MKKKKLARVVSSIMLVLALVAVLLPVACAKPAPAPSPTPAPTPAPAPAPTPAPPPKPITLKMVSFQVPRATSCTAAAIFGERVTEQTKGAVTINYVGGPEVIPIFDQPDALRTGAIDIMLHFTASYESLVPEGGVFALSRLTPAEEYKSGFVDYMIKAHEKLNARYLGRLNTNHPFFIFTNKKVAAPSELAGMKIASIGANIDISKALGMAVIPTPHAKVYSSVERGLVDAVTWPMGTIDTYKGYEVLKYCIDEGYYGANNLVLLMNLDKWNQLSKEQQDLVMKNILKIQEEDMISIYAEYNAAAREKALAAGMEFISFSPESGKSFLDVAYNVGWEGVAKNVTPEVLAKLKTLTGTR